jgi:preprotein translocase subunit SecG
MKTMDIITLVLLIVFVVGGIILNRIATKAIDNRNTEDNK